MQKWIYCASLLLLATPALGVWSANNVGTLHDALTTGYKTHIRPSQTTTVDLEFGMSSLSDLNIVHQTMDVLGFLKASWTDSRLSWTPSSYSDINATYMIASLIWVPPLILNNAAEGIEFMSDNTDIQSVPLHVDSTGHVVWLIPAEFAASCDVIIFSYPFDTQTCNLLISSWMYTGADLDVTINVPIVNMDIYQINGEWDYASSSVVKTTRTIHGHILPAADISITFNRKTGYYIVNMLLPVILLTVLGCFVFLLPVESGEKNGYSLTILLSLSVVLTIVADSIPTTSTHISILSVYLLTTFTLCAVEVLITALTVRWHTWDADGYKLPTWLQRLMQSKLAPLTKYKRPFEVDRLAEKDTSTGKVDLEIATVNGDTDKPKSPTAWDQTSETSVKDYSFCDFTIVLDILNFYLFSLLTFLINTVFLIVLVAS